MKLDKTKKYKLLGLVFSWNECNGPWFWVGLDAAGVKRMAISTVEMAYQLAQGNAEGAREPREFKTTGFREATSAQKRDSVKHLTLHDPLPEWIDAYSSVEVTIREVLK